MIGSITLPHMTRFSGEWKLLGNQIRKLIARDRFSEHTSYLIICRNITKGNGLPDGEFTQEIVINFDVMSLSMKDWIGHPVNCG